MTTSQPATPLTASQRAVLGDRIYCDDELGLVSIPVDTLPEPNALRRLNYRNESVLRAVTMLEEHDESPAEDAERAELHRLEGKLDLALELLAELVRDREPGAPVVTMRFSGEGLCWSSAERLEPGTLLLTEWFVLPAWPVALKLHARVEASESRDHDYLLCARLEGQSDTVRDWLDKLVFRRHRRAIAQQRVTRDPDAASADPAD